MLDEIHRIIVTIPAKGPLTSPYNIFLEALRDKERLFNIGIAIKYLIRTIEILKHEPLAGLELLNLECHDHEKALAICLSLDLKETIRCLTLTTPTRLELTSSEKEFIPKEIRERILSTYLLCLRYLNVALLKSQEEFLEKCPNPECLCQTIRSSWIITSWVCSECGAKLPSDEEEYTFQERPTPKENSCPECEQEKVIWIIKEIMVLCSNCGQQYPIKLAKNSEPELLKLIQNISRPPNSSTNFEISDLKGLKEFFREIMLIGYN